MNRIIIIAAIAICCLSIAESHAQKVIKDAGGVVYIDVTDMPTGSYFTTSLNKIVVLDRLLYMDIKENGVYKKLQIAKSDLGSKMTWAEAVGISTSYNTTSAAGVVTQGTSSGCATYREGGVSGWRVPTTKELVLMAYLMNDFLVEAGVTTLFNSNSYWSSMEGDINKPKTAWYVSNLYITPGGIKTELNSVRCVREVN